MAFRHRHLHQDYLSLRPRRPSHIATYDEHVLQGADYPTSFGAVGIDVPIPQPHATRSRGYTVPRLGIGLLKVAEILAAEVQCH